MSETPNLIDPPSPSPAPLPSDPPAPSTEGAGPPVNPAAPVEPPVRPDWLGDQFADYWADDKGFDSAKLTEDFEAMRALKAEHDERAADTPEDSSGYEIVPPEKFEAPKGFEVPEGFTFDRATIEADPVMKEWLPVAQEAAKANGLTKTQYNALINAWGQYRVIEQQLAQRRVAKEREQLGGNGQARITQLWTDVEGIVGKEPAQHLREMVVTLDRFQAFETLAKLAKAGKERGGAPSQPGAGGREAAQPQGSGMTAEEWDKLSPTQKIVKGRALDAQKRKAS